jgi:serine/threonine protein phosphatase PrpC
LATKFPKEPAERSAFFWYNTDVVIFGFGKESVASAEASPRVRACAVSNPGLVRQDNQDHVFVDDDRLVYCVADGVGGAREGARASEIVCRNVKMVLSAAPADFTARVEAVSRAVADANAAIFAHARERGYDAMGSTVAVLVLDPANPRHAAICHVGDSRVYRIRGGMPQQLTRDHRQGVGEHTLTRAVGAEESVVADWFEITSTNPSRFILCTDGVHDVESEVRLAVFVSAGPIESAAQRLSADIERRGAPDNYSFVIVEV